MDWECWLSGSSSFQFCSCLADGPRVQCSSRVLRVLARLCFRSDLVLVFHCSRFAYGPSFSSGRSVARADGPPGLRGRSVFLGSVLVVLFALTDGPRLRPDSPRQGCGQSAVPCRTVRAAIADSPPCPAGWSARAWLLCSLVRFLPPSFMLPRVFQGLVVLAIGV
jgi:hypothetical protein